MQNIVPLTALMGILSIIFLIFLALMGCFPFRKDALDSPDIFMIGVFSQVLGISLRQIFLFILMSQFLVRIFIMDSSIYKEVS